MVKLNQLPWLSSASTIFAKQLSEDTMPHAQLLGIEHGYGAELLLEHLSNLALCNKPINGEACSFCHSCQLTAAGTHPDLHIIKPDGQQIKVDQIRQLCRALANTSQQGGKRIAVIYECEKMNVAAANALLKTLEEPGRDTLLLLQTSSPSLLMATISSRCQEIAVHLPSKDDLHVWLQQNSQVSGDMTWAMPIVGGPLNLIESVTSGYYQTLLSYRKDWSQSLMEGHLCTSFLDIDEKEIVDILDVLYLVLRQFVIQKKYADPLLQANIIKLASEVMTKRQRLTLMSNVSAPGLCQQIILKYRHLTNH
ncbi:DNA polymerase III subunit delta' [Shewanella sp. OPT22]|nr:DNA polymerase III subunit delta' [Shewanella sp. OPT22]